MFGNTVLAGRVRTADAYPVGEVRTEERNGVAIDRVFGSVAGGALFQMEVVTKGEFKTKIAIRNFTVAQLGLLALALRDLKLGRVGIGFGKSRGLGRVTARFDRLTVRYPACQVSNGDLRLLSGERLCGATELAGADAFDVPENYGYKSGALKIASLPAGLGLVENDWLEPVLEVSDEAQIEDVWRACVPSWREAAVNGK
jgi:hypothetical protein